MRYFLDGEEYTFEEFKQETEDWEYHSEDGYGHQVTVLVCIIDDRMYFHQTEFEC